METNNDYGRYINHIIFLLYSQNPYDPLNSEAANQYLLNENEFHEKVNRMVKEYGNLDDYENLYKQNIQVLDECTCMECERFSLSFF